MYDARQLDARPHTVPPPSPLAVLRLASVPMAPRLLGQVGEAFAAALAAVQRRLDDGDLETVRRELSRLERLGVQLQEAARVLNGDGGFRVESVELSAAVRQAVADWSSRAAARGVTLNGPSQPFQGDVVAGIVEQLLDLSLEHALHLGSRVSVGCGAEGAPPRPMLTLHIARENGPPLPVDALDDLHWQLVAMLSHALGGSAHRTATADGLVLAIALAEPETPLSNRTEEGGLPRLGGLVGRRIVLVEADEGTRVMAARLMSDAGALVEAALTPESVVDELEAGRPAAEVLVVGGPPASPRIAPLVQALRARQPKLRVVELVDDAAAFEMSVPGSDHPARVGRPSLPRTLVPAVAQELETVGR